MSRLIFTVKKFFLNTGVFKIRPCVCLSFVVTAVRKWKGLSFHLLEHFLIQRPWLDLSPSTKMYGIVTKIKHLTRGLAEPASGMLLLARVPIVTFLFHCPLGH